MFGRERPRRDLRPGVVRASTVAVVAFGLVMLALALTAMVAALLG